MNDNIETENYELSENQTPNLWRCRHNFKTTKHDKETMNIYNRQPFNNYWTATKLKWSTFQTADELIPPMPPSAKSQCISAHFAF